MGGGVKMIFVLGFMVRVVIIFCLCFWQLLRVSRMAYV